MKVVIIRYNAGNIQSVAFALQRLGMEAIITDSIEEIQSADKVIFPGVGEATSAMCHLKQVGLDKLIVGLKQPVLGICLGMQLMCRYSEEGNVDCLGIFDRDVKMFTRQEQTQKIPHMGWNSLYDLGGELFRGVFHDDYVYFVHSYYVGVCEFTTAACDYIHPFSAALQKNNFYATQFHPEKSGDIGERMLKNFVEMAF